MNSLEATYFDLLTNLLSERFVPHLPPLQNPPRTPEDQSRKNLSRAFSAFALRWLCDVAEEVAAASVVDDFNDCGIDAIYFDKSTTTLYLVQSKLKQAEPFSQKDALAFCQGVRKFIRQDFDGFNQAFKNRQAELESAYDECSQIQLVVAHAGTAMSMHAANAISELLDAPEKIDDRLTPVLIEYNGDQVRKDLLRGNAYQPVDTDIFLKNHFRISEPRETHFGIANLSDLVDLHHKHDTHLYARNIRTHLGHETSVNSAIFETLRDAPQQFLYLNNGVAALYTSIAPRGTRDGRKCLRVQGISIINGAQTIASGARASKTTPPTDLSSALVFFTLIKNTDDAFGDQVTRARNHQNPVAMSDFVALDSHQERLRRELEYLGVRYIYRAGTFDLNSTNHIHVSEAAPALALLQADPRFAVWLKVSPGQMLDTESDQYTTLFNDDVTGHLVVNAVRFLRFIRSYMEEEVTRSTGVERTIYKHCAYVLGWVVGKHIVDAARGTALFSDAGLRHALGKAMDEVRQILVDETNKLGSGKGPLAIFRSMTESLPLIDSIATKAFGLSGDQGLASKHSKQTPGEPYPVEVFRYLAAKAQRISIPT